MTNDPAARDTLFGGERTPVAQLHPDITDLKSRVVEGEITVIWPFNIVTKLIAFKLAESDFRLRFNKGQVRVELYGAAGKAVSKAAIGSGDVVHLSLDGAEWEKPSSQAPARPDTLEWQLKFTNRLRLKVRRAESQDEEDIDVEASDSVDESALIEPPSETAEPSTPRANSPVQTIPVPNSAAPNQPTKRLASSAFESDEYASPAFLKRARVSYGSLFEGGLDLFDDERRGGPKKKRSRFSMHANWRYTSRTPSPEPEHQSDIEDDAVEPEPAQEHDRDVPGESSPRQPMVDEGCQTQVVTSPAVSVQVSSEVRPPAEEELGSHTPVSPSGGQVNKDEAVRNVPISVREPQHENIELADSQPATGPEETPQRPAALAPVPGFTVSNGTFQQASDETNSNVKNVAASPPGLSEEHGEEDDAERLFGSNGFYTTPMDFEAPTNTRSFEPEDQPQLPTFAQDITNSIPAFAPSQLEQETWSTLTSLSAPPPAVKQNDIDNPVEIIDSSSPIREPSPNEDHDTREFGDQQPEVPAHDDAEHDDSHEIEHTQADELPEGDNLMSIRSHVPADDNEEDADDFAGEGYDMRNYDDAQDNDVVESDESSESDVDKSDPGQQVVDFEGENDQSEEEERRDSGEAVYESHGMDEHSHAGEDGKFDAETEEFDEDYGSEQYDYEEYYEDEEEMEYDGEEMEYDWEDEEDEEPGPKPAVSQDPVFISLLSDSEEEDEDDGRQAEETARGETPQEQRDPSSSTKEVANEAPEQPEQEEKSEMGSDVAEESAQAETPPEIEEQGQLSQSVEATRVGFTSHQPTGDRSEPADQMDVEEEPPQSNQPAGVLSGFDELDRGAEPVDDHATIESSGPGFTHINEVEEEPPVTGVSETVRPEDAITDVQMQTSGADDSNQDLEMRQAEPVAMKEQTHIPDDKSVAAGKEQAAISNDAGLAEPSVDGDAEPPVKAGDSQEAAAAADDQPAAEVPSVTAEAQPVQDSGPDAQETVAERVIEDDAKEPVQEDKGAADGGPQVAEVEEAKTPAASETETQPEQAPPTEPGDEAMEETPAVPPGEVEKSESPRPEPEHTAPREVESTDPAAAMSPPPTQAHKEEALTKAHEAPVQAGMGEVAGMGYAGQVLTPGDTQRDDDAAVHDDEGNDMSEADYSFAAEQQIMAESQAYEASQQQPMGSFTSTQGSDEGQTQSSRGPSEQRVRRSKPKAKPERDILITVQSLRSWDRRKSMSSVATEDDPSIALARAPSEASTNHVKSQEKKSPTTVRVTRSKAEDGDPSIQLAQALETPRRRRRRDVTTPEPRETRAMSQSLQSKTPESHASHLMKSPSAAESMAEGEQVPNLKVKLTRELRENLPDFLSLKTLRNSLNKVADFIGVATMTPTPAYRPKKGLDFKLELFLTDPSTAPSTVSVALIFRGREDTLPAVQKGDVVLLRRFKVVSMKGRGFGVRSEDASAWEVYEQGDEEMLPQIRGPPVDKTDKVAEKHEVAHAEGLRKWWNQLDDKAKERVDKATQKMAAQAGKGAKGK